MCSVTDMSEQHVPASSSQEPVPAGIFCALRQPSHSAQLGETSRIGREGIGLFRLPIAAKLTGIGDEGFIKQTGPATSVAGPV